MIFNKIKASPKILLLVLWLLCNNAFSQNVFQQNTFQNSQRDQLSFANDSSHKWQPFKVQEIKYTIGNDAMKQYSIDTSLQNFQIYDPAQLANFNYRTIGNIGLAAYPIFFQPNVKFGFDLGYNAFNLYKLNTENIRWFNNINPFTEFNLIIGRNREQLVNVYHAQNIKNRFFFNFEYNRVAGRGSFRNQQANNNSFSVSTLYKTKKQRYNIGGSFIFNNISTQENGGIEDRGVLYQDTALISKELLAVNLTSAITEMRDREVLLQQELAFGKMITKRINDTLSYQELAPIFKVYHRLGYERNLVNYSDTENDLDSVYYNTFYPTKDTTLIKDSLGNNILLQNLSNKAGILLQFIDSFDSTNVSYKNFVLDISLEHDYFSLRNNNTNTLLQNLNLIGLLSSHPTSEKPFIYKAKAAISFINYNSGDLILEGLLGYNFKKWGQIEASVKQQRSEPSWVFQNFTIRDYSWNNNFNKTNILSFGLDYSLPKYHVQLSGKFYNITNLLYFDELRLPQQFAGNTQVWMLSAMKNFRYKGLGLDNMVRLQFFSGSDLIRMPETWIRHSVFYEKKIFKGALQTRLGVDMSYNTNYYANGYFGLTNQFFVQNAEWLKFYPLFDIWASFKIKTFRLFIKVDHVNQGLFKQKNQYNYLDYPGIQRSFRIGLSWRFYD